MKKLLKSMKTMYCHNQLSKFMIMKYILLIFLTILFVRCTENDIDTFNAKDVVYFETNEVKYAFAYHPEEEEAKVPIAIQLIGNLSDQARVINFEVDKEKTSANEINYSLPDQFAFGANKDIDTLWVNIKNSEDLKTEEKQLVLTLKSSSDFDVRYPERDTVKIIMNDILGQPEWWDAQVENYFLGTYSDKKFQLFIQVTGISDMTDLSEAHKRAYTLQLKYYLQEQADKGEEFIVREEDGSVMKVKIYGY